MSGYTKPLRVREDEGEEKTPEELGYSVMSYTPHGRIEPEYTPPPPRPAKKSLGPRAGPRLPVSSTLGPALTPHLGASVVPPSEIPPIQAPSHATTPEGPPKQRPALSAQRSARSAMGRRGGHAKARKARLASMNAEVDAELGAETSPTPGPEPRPAMESASYINPLRVREASLPPRHPSVQTSFADLAPPAPAAPLRVPDESEGGIQLRAPGPSQQAQQAQDAERFLWDNMGQGHDSRQLGFDDMGPPCATEGCPHPATSSEPGALCENCQAPQLPLEEPHSVVESAWYINPLRP